MIARTRAVIAADGSLAELHCQPPLTLRRITPAPPGTCALCLVGSAAGPLAGDDLVLSLEVAPGGSATLQAAGAAIAQGRGGQAAGLRLEAVIGAGGTLRADPGALVVRPGGRVQAAVDLRLADGATADWRELIVLGAARPGGPAPAAAIRWDVTRCGRPLLRQVADFAGPQWLRWPGMAGGRRVLAAALLAGPGVAARTVIAAPEAVAQQLAPDAALVTVLGDDAASAARQRDELCAELLSGNELSLRGDRR